MNLRSRNRGLTLIELLVVIGIAVVLAAMLLPTLRNSRRAASSGVCVSNLRQIYQLSSLWSLDNDGYLPQAQWYTTNLPSPYINLTRYGLTKKMTVCPVSGLESPTYGINSRLVTGSPQWGPNDAYFWSRGKYKLSLLGARTVFFAETIQQSWSGKAGAYISVAESAAMPHFGKGNVLFADGHVESLGATELKTNELWTNGIP
jgi:prepilin-type processing-associated H-X9-DG protein/prepilin-type N-terminal cleavage/methylation domain-containing protein